MQFVNCLVCGKKIKSNPKKKKCPHCHRELEWMVLDDRVHLFSVTITIEKQKKVECLNCGNMIKNSSNNKTCKYCKSELVWIDRGDEIFVLSYCITSQNERIYYRSQEG